MWWLHIDTEHPQNGFGKLGLSWLNTPSVIIAPNINIKTIPNFNSTQVEHSFTCIDIGVFLKVMKCRW